MAADELAVGRDHIARLRGQVFGKELFEVSLADKTHAGGVFFFRNRQPRLASDGAHLWLEQAAHGEHGHGKRALADLIEKVGLVLIFIGCAQKRIFAAGAADAGEVAGGQLVRAQFFGKAQKGGKFDFAVA